MENAMTTVTLLKTFDGVEANVTQTLTHKPAFVIGSDSRSDLRLTLKDIQPAHAIITLRETGCVITPRTPAGEVRLNGKVVRFASPLKSGDTIQLGAASLTVAQHETDLLPVGLPAPKQAVLPASFVTPTALSPVSNPLSPVFAPAAAMNLSAQPREIYFPQSASAGGISMAAFFSGLVTLVVVVFVIGYGFLGSSPVTAADITSQYAFNDGHVTVVMFEASWCTFCKQQKPMLNEIASDYRGKVYNQYLDAEAPANIEMVTAFNVSAYPVTLIFNDQGQVTAKFLGLTDARTIRVAIDQALRESGQQT